MNVSSDDRVRTAVRAFLVTEFLESEEESRLEDTTPLITGGILDSIGAVRLVVFLEEKFDIEIPQAEVTVGHLDSVRQIVQMVEHKLEAKSL